MEEKPTSEEIKKGTTNKEKNWENNFKKSRKKSIPTNFEENDKGIMEKKRKGGRRENRHQKKTKEDEVEERKDENGNEALPERREMMKIWEMDKKMEKSERRRLNS